MQKIDMTAIQHIKDLKDVQVPFTLDHAHKELKTCHERELSENKIVPSLEEAIRQAGLQDGMTISFHHHFRNGDYVVNMVMDTIAKMGFKDLVLAPSSLIDIHKPLIEHIRNGVIRRIETSGIRGDLAEAISRGLMDIPVVFRSHGGRAAVIESGQLPIDIAFLGAPSCDPFGNANGYSRDNDKGVICGSMGYAKLDAQYAKKVIILTDNIVPFPNVPFGIPESDVDFVVEVDAIGDPNGIMGGSTRFTTNPKELMIAQKVSEVIEATDFFRNGFSIQMGSGGASLATVRFLKDKMIQHNIKASFALGGITGQIVQLHEEGLIKKILDVQSFDLVAARSLKDNRFHQQISASYYASPHNTGSAVNQLDFVILSALEVDTKFNINVLTGSDGVIRGAIGGHCDTAAGASVSIITCPLTRGRIATIVDKVNTVVTPGKTIDIVVTDQGVAVNPLRNDLITMLTNAGIDLCTIEQLREKAARIVGDSTPITYTDKVVGVVTYRDGSVIDLIYQVKDEEEV
ncbi:citrate lyase, alpha subunit [Sphaerochaeta pleomorpha str. Grapes]|uniref:Citrate lyase alpha chain n=1 Tax=Sphaerochaeta pleomorpha (strain ATCC BAA-1885 / DSM 22778 / Grapes) TaxID=158190 RepID=G8QUL5_SPHPG|nr:citrate lyase subunit alpha [Sphaerochaeta pleomorpha]AEV30323.1 citrate lyase, alpha subunit [Sphaerochaeta pleomorpha str. Grapes]